MLNKTEIENKFVNEKMTEILDVLSDVNNKKKIVIFFPLLSNEALIKIAQKLSSGRYENPIEFNLSWLPKERDFIEGITALMKALQANPGIKKLTVRASINPDAHLSSALTILNLLKNNHTLSSFTFIVNYNKLKKTQPGSDLFELLYTVLEKHPSIKKLCLNGFGNMHLYGSKFYQLNNLSSVEFTDCHGSHSIFTYLSPMNLKLPNHFTAFKLRDNLTLDINFLLTLLRKIYNSKITKFSFSLQTKNALSEMTHPYNFLLGMLSQSENLVSFSLTGDISDHTRDFYTRQQSFVVEYFSPKKSYMEQLFDVLKETKTLKELKINTIEFMQEMQNVVALSNALNSNRSLTKLSLRYVSWYFSILGGHEKYTDQLMDAIFSNPNLKTLEITGIHYKRGRSSNLSCLIKNLVSGHGLTELNLSHSYYDKDDIKLLAELLESNTKLESVDLSYCEFHEGSGVSFWGAIQKNKNLNLRRFDITNSVIFYGNTEDSQGKNRIKLAQRGINLDLEWNFPKIIRKILLRGVCCKQSPLKALKGRHESLELIWNFLFAKQGLKVKLFDRKETKEFKETKEKKELKENKEQKLKMDKVVEAGNFIGLKKLSEEAAMTRQTREIPQPKNTTEEALVEAQTDSHWEELPPRLASRQGLRYRGTKSLDS